MLSESAEDARRHLDKTFFRHLCHILRPSATFEGPVKQEFEGNGDHGRPFNHERIIKISIRLVCDLLNEKQCKHHQRSRVLVTADP
jgi:hypothetical protein